MLDRLITASSRYRGLTPIFLVVGFSALLLIGTDLLRDTDLPFLSGLAQDRWIIPASVVTLWMIIGLWMLSAFPNLPLTSERPDRWWPRFIYRLKRGLGYLLIDFAALLLIISLFTSYRMLAIWF